MLRAADIPEEEARYWAKKLEQLNAMRDQDVSLFCNISYPYLQPLILSYTHILFSTEHIYLFRIIYFI